MYGGDKPPASSIYCPKYTYETSLLLISRPGYHMVLVQGPARSKRSSLARSYMGFVRVDFCLTMTKVLKQFYTSPSGCFLRLFLGSRGSRRNMVPNSVS